MPIDIDADVFENITEIYGIGQNSVEVVAKNHRRFRVYAARVIRGANARYFAHYEEQIEIKTEGREEETEVFVEADLPWQAGDTISDCLLSALGWIDGIGDKSGD